MTGDDEYDHDHPPVATDYSRKTQTDQPTESDESGMGGAFRRHPVGNRWTPRIDEPDVEQSPNTERRHERTQVPPVAVVLGQPLTEIGTGLTE